MTLAIADYALIGDCETAALVGRDGSIDWLCLPRFDSDACFAKLLGGPEHGCWCLKPTDEQAKVSRRYRPRTLILETRFETDKGAVLVTDFMPGRRTGSSIVRIVTGERGEVAMHGALAFRFGYGATIPWVTRLPTGGLRAIAGPDMVLLHTNAPLRGEDFTTKSDFTVAEGQSFAFELIYSPSHLDPPYPGDPQALLRDTEYFWLDWAAKESIDGPYGEVIERSLITLKALTYAQTGGIVAAPTTSLPEQTGGARNWDYRFCWLRDATLTLLSLMNAGHFDEAHAWREWLLRAAAGKPSQLQIMYGIAGERRLTEWEVPWLPGYRNSQPVRIGNAAHTQLQLDVYGELMDALHQGRAGGLAASEDGWALQIAVLEQLEKVWRQPDEGIWEVRSGPEHFTYSKVMAWVAFDRALESAEQFQLDGPLEKWRALCQTIHEDICANGYDEKRNSFVRSYGSRELDASLLLLPVVGFLPPDDERIRGTVAAIEKDLLIDGFVRRYRTENAKDGLAGSEGVFLACSFWLVDAYVLLGRHEDARRLFERLLTLRNDVGLLSEEYDTDARELIGNFPQALSHIALVNSAFNLTRVLKPAKQRAQRRNAPQN